MEQIQVHTGHEKYSTVIAAVECSWRILHYEGLTQFDSFENVFDSLHDGRHTHIAGPLYPDDIGSHSGPG